MTACDLHPGVWYRYHGEPALYLGMARRQFVFEINTAAGVLRVRVSARQLKEITTL